MSREPLPENYRPGANLPRTGRQAKRNHVRIFAKTYRGNRNVTERSRFEDDLRNRVSNYDIITDNS